MAIGRVESNSVSFKGFYTNPKGAYNLASELVGKPALEQKFMQNLVGPLSQTKMYSVFVNGDIVGIMNNEGKGLMSIWQPGYDYDRSLAVVYDYAMQCKNVITRNSYVEPTNNFEKDGYLLRSIEIAKNIIFDKEAMAANQAAETYTKVANETLEQKSDRFTSSFKFNG